MLLFLPVKGVAGSSDASGNVGEAITLECHFRGYVNGLVERMWTRGENALPVSDKYSMQYVEDVLSLGNGTNYTIANFYLTIQTLNSFYEGNYTCVIDNNNNIETHTIILSTHFHITNGVPKATDITSKFSLDERSTTNEGENVITTRIANIATYTDKL